MSLSIRRKVFSLSFFLGEVLTQIADQVVGLADLAITLMLATTRRLIPADDYVRSGGWSGAQPSPSMRPGPGMTGRKIGVYGMGEIGREVAVRAAAFGMNVIYHQRTQMPAALETAHHAHYADLVTLLETCDWVVICLPGNANTRNLFNSVRFAQMKPGALLVNVARGDLVDTEALVQALQDGRLAAAALDVFDPEPLPADHALRLTKHPSVAARRTELLDAALRRLQG